VSTKKKSATKSRSTSRASRHVAASSASSASNATARTRAGAKNTAVTRAKKGANAKTVGQPAKAARSRQREKAADAASGKTAKASAVRARAAGRSTGAKAEATPATARTGRSDTRRSDARGGGQHGKDLHALIDGVERHLAEVEAALDHYRALYERAPVGYVTLDGHGTMVEANRCAGERLGLEHSEVAGRKLESLVDASSRSTLRAHLREVFASSVARHCELLTVDAAGTESWMAAISLRADGAAGRSRRCRTVLVDVTDRKKTEASLRNAYDDLERGVRERTLELEHADVTLRAELAARKEVQEALRASEKRIRTVAGEAAMAEQRERRRLASDLHDGLGQLLSLAGMRLDAIAHFDRVDPGALHEIRAVLSQAQDLSESLTFQLSPPVLHDVGLVAACRRLGEEVVRIYDFDVRIEAEGEHRWSDEAVSATVFRALREFLINAAQHSRAHHALLRFRVDAPDLEIVVEDRGVGFDSAAAKGFGMSNAAERLRYLGGEVQIDSAPGKGTRIRVIVPVEPDFTRRRRPAP
jgi:PAS domain S-box-containing protein